jgi:hypothetical protein
MLFWNFFPCRQGQAFIKGAAVRELRKSGSAGGQIFLEKGIVGPGCRERNGHRKSRGENDKEYERVVRREWR